jgi:hypothetical protein
VMCRIHRTRTDRRQTAEALSSLEAARAREAVVDRLVNSVNKHTEENGFATVIRRALGEPPL